MDWNCSTNYKSGRELPHTNKEQIQKKQDETTTLESHSKFHHSVEPSTSSKFIPICKQDLKGYRGPPKQLADKSSNKEDTGETHYTFGTEIIPQVDDNRRLFIEKRNNQNKLKYLIGKVDHAIRWCKQLKDLDYTVIYQIVGIVEHIMCKGLQKLFFLRGDSGQILQCVFYNIDRELPDFPCGSFIRVTGKMKGSNKMQIYDAEIISQDEVEEALPRLTFFSQRLLNEITKK